LLAVSHSGTARFIYYSPLACQWQTEIELEENCEELNPCYFPNSFSPNYDNLNDTYRIECENIIEFEMSIFNRWGEQIYTSNNPSQTWDGTYKGMACPTGIYFATIKLEIPSQDGNIRSKIQKISIHLVR
jgi:gliding motility-associated-like protein